MPNFALQNADPLGLGSITDGPILVTDITGGPRKDYAEVLGGDARYIDSAVKELRPIEEWTISYELLTGASLTVPLGVPVNTNYLVTAVSGSSGPDAYPTASVTAIKPSNANKIKNYVGAAVTFDMVGGFGIVNKHGMTAASAFISTSASISMSTAEALEETSGDYLLGGIYHYGFKLEGSGEAYGAITIPANAKLTDSDTRESREGWQTYSASWWSYVDAH